MGAPDFRMLFSSGSPELATGSELRSKRVMAAARSSLDLPVWRLSVSRVLATDRSRQISCFSLCLPPVHKMPYVYDSVTTPRHGIKLLIQTTKNVMKTHIDKRTLSLLATADIGSGSSFVGPFPPTKCRGYKANCLSCTRTSHRGDMLLATFCLLSFCLTALGKWKNFTGSPFGCLSTIQGIGNRFYL